MVIHLDGVLLHYEVFGEGRPLLLLHGWGGCINAMAPIWQYFKENFKVYVLDFPGQNNESEDPPVPWGIPEYAKLVKDFIKMFAIEKPDVIAHSFGGRVAIYLASEDSNLFHRIVLTDSAGVKPKNSLRKGLRKQAFRIGKHILKITHRGEKYEEALAKLRYQYASPDYRALKTDVMRKTFQNVISLDLTSRLKEIHNPTLLMWGEKDMDTPLYMAKVMEKNIPDAGLVVIENAGHFSYLDASSKYCMIVNEFLK